MHPNVRQGARRVHATEFKVKVVAQCREPGASVAAVAMANGVNANLVRKWLVGQGLKRTVRTVPQDGAPAPDLPRTSTQAVPAPPVPSAMKFVPLGLTAASSRGSGIAPDMLGPVPAEVAHIHVELRRGEASMAVRWPTSQAYSCAAWLCEVVGGLLKG